MSNIRRLLLRNYFESFVEECGLSGKEDERHLVNVIRLAGLSVKFTLI